MWICFHRFRTDKPQKQHCLESIIQNEIKARSSFIPVKDNRAARSTPYGQGRKDSKLKRHSKGTAKAQQRHCNGTAMHQNEIRLPSTSTKVGTEVILPRTFKRAIYGLAPRSRPRRKDSIYPVAAADCAPERGITNNGGKARGFDMLDCLLKISSLASV